MIIYGTGERKILSDNLMCDCTVCNAKNSVQMMVFQKYAHVFWIPFFPIKKRTVCYCDACHEQFGESELSRSGSLSYVEARARSKTPFYMFSLCFLIIGLLAFIYFSEQYDSRQTNAFVENPKIGDIYEYKIDTKEYTLLKVVDMNADTVFFVFNTYVTDERSGLSKLYDKPYDEGGAYILQPDIIELLKDGHILKVKRN